MHTHTSLESNSWQSLLTCPLASFTSVLSFFFFFFFFFLTFVFLGPHPRHMAVPRLGVQLELLLLAYTTTTAMPDPSCICNLHHSSQQRQILNPSLNKARDRTLNLMVPSQIRFHCTTKRTPKHPILKNLCLTYQKEKKENS